MLKIYRFQNSIKEYWETWEETPEIHRVHWGTLGTSGTSKKVQSTFFRKARTIIQKEVDQRINEGFRPIDPENLSILMIEYHVNGTGSAADVDKRHRLEQRMNETLGWTGLGACDGGSMGSGTMEVCNFVVDFELAKQVIQDDLADTEFSNYTRIYDENST